MSSSEALFGDLLDLATVISPKLGKTWYTLANWCYKWGRKSADKLQFNLNQSNGAQINNELDRSGLLELLPAHSTQEEKDFIVNLFSRGFNSISISRGSERPGDESAELNKETFLNEAREQMLLNCKCLTSESVERILEYWKNIVNRVFYFHRIACRAYFTFLNLSETVSYFFLLKSKTFPSTF